MITKFYFNCICIIDNNWSFGKWKDHSVFLFVCFFSDWFEPRFFSLGLDDFTFLFHAPLGAGIYEIFKDI